MKLRKMRGRREEVKEAMEKRTNGRVETRTRKYGDGRMRKRKETTRKEGGGGRWGFNEQ